MPTAQELRSALYDALQAMSDQYEAISDPAEQATIADSMEQIKAIVARVEIDDLNDAAGMVGKAASAMQSAIAAAQRGAFSGYVDDLKRIWKTLTGAQDDAAVVGAAVGVVAGAAAGAAAIAAANVPKPAPAAAIGAAAGAAAGAVAGAAAAMVSPTVAAAVGGASGLSQLARITGPIPVRELGEPELRELQIMLARLGYPVGTIDGQFGPRTRNAWAEFKADVFPGNPDLIGPEAVLTLQEQLSKLPSLQHDDFSTKQSTIQAIRKECGAQGLGLPTQVAYVLATTQWETAQTFKPVKEAFWKPEQWRKDNLLYYPYYGRGYVQLTWKRNYEAYSQILGVDLVNNPDRAMDQKVALFVLVHGFKNGVFTGRKITDYIDASRTDFVNARRCINGVDKAAEIAKLAQAFLGQG